MMYVNIKKYQMHWQNGKRKVCASGRVSGRARVCMYAQGRFACHRLFWCLFSILFCFISLLKRQFPAKTHHINIRARILCCTNTRRSIPIDKRHRTHCVTNINTHIRMHGVYRQSSFWFYILRPYLLATEFNGASM